MMTSRQLTLALLVGLGWSAMAAAQQPQNLGTNELGNNAGTPVEMAALVAPGETLPVNVAPFADAARAVDSETPLAGLENTETNTGSNYSLELGETPVLVVKQHTLNPLIDLNEDHAAARITLDENGIPILGIRSGRGSL